MEPDKTAAKEKIKVLIVEDDKFLQKILSMKFGGDGFDVRAASDGEEAVKQVLADKPQLVLLDLILPKMNGFEVLAELKTNTNTQTIPVVILSNLGQEEDVKRALDLGAVDFLIKSNISIQEVVHRSKEAYARHLSKIS